MRRSVVALAVVTVVVAGILLWPDRIGDAAGYVPITTPPTTERQRPAPERPEAAAVRYGAMAQDWLYLDDTALEASVRSIATEDGGQTLVDAVLGDVRELRVALAVTNGRIWWFVRPLAYRVDGPVTERARVDVWSVSVLSAADVAMPQADWTTTTFELELVDGDWLVDRTSDQPGPTPQTGGGDTPWEPEPFDRSLTGFTRIGAEP
jgi:hypothetical protein